MASAGAQNRQAMTQKTEATIEATTEATTEEWTDEVPDSSTDSSTEMSNEMSNEQAIEKTIDKQVWIAAPPVVVWRVLTEPAQIQRWLAEPQLGARIETTWQVGSPIVIRGVHHVPFEARGTVLFFEPPWRLGYSQLSSLSRLPDVPESYAQIVFVLRLTDRSTDGGTQLQLTIQRCATAAIYKHLEFYWGTTLQLIKASAEEAMAPAEPARKS